MLGLSGRASLPALGTPCGSGIPSEELVTQEGLQEQFAKDSTHTGHLQTADPIPTHWQAESGGSHKRRGSWQKWFQKCGLCPPGSLQGPPGLFAKASRGPREEATLGPAAGEGRRQRAVQGGTGKGRGGPLTVVFHCTHIITHTWCSNNCASQAVPASHPSDEAVPRLNTKRPQNADTWGPGPGLLPPAPPKPRLRSSV